MFPWQCLDAAPREGWWLNTLYTPGGMAAIEEIDVHDRVICQRTDPGPGLRDPGDSHPTDTLIGICEVGMVEAWDDIDKGRDMSPMQDIAL
jgi:hypothetical protein